MRILICGMNGAGKSTLGRALADALGFPFRDAEDYWFPKDGAYLYERPRTEEEVNALLLADLRKLPDAVYAVVRCREREAAALFDMAVYVDVPKEERMARIRQRSHRKFGARMLPGGDLHEREERFFAQCAQRPQSFALDWLKETGLPFLTVDGRKPVAENAAHLVQCINEKYPGRHPPMKITKENHPHAEVCDL